MPTTDDEINTPECRNGFGDGVFELLRLPHVGLGGNASLARAPREFIGAVGESLEADVMVRWMFQPKRK